MRITITPAIAVILHIIWSGVFGLIVAGGTALIQYNASHGFDPAQDLSIFALTVLTGFGSMQIQIWHNIQASPALPQAERDVKDQATQAAVTLAQQAHTRIDQIITALQQHTHTAPQAAQSANTPPVLRPTTPQPMPANSTPVAPQSASSGALTTLPGIPIVQAQQ